MSAHEVVDLSADDAHRARRRVWLRTGIPLGGVAVVILAILAISYYAERQNRAGVLLLTEDLLANLQDRIAEEVAAYLDPATRITRLAYSVTRNPPDPP